MDVATEDNGDADVQSHEDVLSPLQTSNASVELDRRRSRFARRYSYQGQLVPGMDTIVYTRAVSTIVYTRAVSTIVYTRAVSTDNASTSGMIVYSMLSNCKRFRRLGVNQVHYTCIC